MRFETYLQLCLEKSDEKNIADINIGKSGEDICGSCRGPRYRDKDTGEDLIRQTSIRFCSQNTLTQNCLFYIFNPSKASAYQKISIKNIKGKYYCDDLGGYGMSELLDQIVDRKAVGKEG